MTKAIPEGYHTLTACFTFKDCKKAIEFYKKAFNAEILDQMPNSNGGTMHATLKIGNSIIMMGDESPNSDNCPKSAETLGNCPISLYMYVEHVDEAFQQAVAAGGITTMSVMDSFWGDRVGQIRDPFGYFWMIASHTKELSDEQIRKGAQEFMASMSQKS